MAGLSGLNGVYGTFSGTRGLNLTPMQMKQKQQMFLAELQQEAKRMEAAQAAQTRGLDLQQRGQDLDTQEAELGRTFAGNLNKSRQDFESQMQSKAEAAAAASQQRAIQEQQRSQGAAQGFAKEESAIERTFKKEESTLDRSEREAARAQSNEQFKASFGLETSKFDFAREIELKDQGRQDRAEELNTEMAELDKQLKGGQITMQQAQSALIVKQVEMVGMELREAMEDVGLSDEQYGKITAKLVAGEDIPAAMAGKLLKSPKAMKAIMGFTELMATAKERGLVNEQTTPEAKARRERGQEADVKAKEAEAKILEKQAGGGEEKTPAATPEEVSGLRELERLNEAGDLGDVGQTRLKALTELQSLGAATDPDAVDRREKLRAFDVLARGMEGEDISDLGFEWTDVAAFISPIAGVGNLILKYGLNGLDRMTEDEKQTAVREMANELGLTE